MIDSVFTERGFESILQLLKMFHEAPATGVSQRCIGGGDRYWRIEQTVRSGVGRSDPSSALSKCPAVGIPSGRVSRYITVAQ